MFGFKSESVFVSKWNNIESDFTLFTKGNRYVYYFIFAKLTTLTKKSTIRLMMIMIFLPINKQPSFFFINTLLTKRNSQVTIIVFNCKGKFQSN